MRHDPKNAVALIREMEPILAAKGYHTALTGSVLYKGGSEKDTDIIVYPHNPEKCLPFDEVLALLVPIGFATKFVAPPHYANREVYTCTYQGRRVDLFFLQ